MRFLSLWVLIVFCPVLLRSQSKPIISPTPVWITTNPVDYNSSTLEKEADDGSIDLDYEKQVNLNDQSVYIKRSTKILSQSGVQDNSQISISFDPSFQKLFIHTINIIRDGATINKLDLSKIKMVHTETDLKKFIYNGEVDAILILEDVRKNDVIEFSYTLRGLNPIFQNKYQTTFDTRLGFPICNILYKIIIPSNRKLNYKNFNDTIQPSIKTENNNTVYEWHKLNLHVMHTQDYLPDWYDPYSSVQISEFNSWNDVSNWATQLFPKNTNITATLKNKINEINTSSSTNEQKVLSALHFVQDDIRYMGIEMGIHSHKPADPNKIFDQRFGDCKEKSYLLCVMLNNMNIAAKPVLINTSYKKAIKDWLPAASDFNHCTVQVTLNNKIYWLDPTLSLQRGKLSEISFPDYQYGMIISDSTTSLSYIKPQGNNVEKIKEFFSVSQSTAPSSLKVETTYSGFYADNVRSDFNENSNYEMQKSYLRFYQNYFDNISIDSLVYTDNDSTGIFTTTEYYTIDTIWKMKDGVKSLDFTCYIISDYLQKPKDVHRTMPLNIDFPEHRIEELNIALSGSGWDFEDVNDSIQNAVFKFTEKSFTYGSGIILDYEYQSFKDYVMPDEAENYLSALQKINQQQDYLVTVGDSVKTNTSSTGNIIGGIVLILVVVGSLIWWTRKR